MDELDRAIVDQLQEEGRKPFTEIAQSLGVSEGTVRNRVSRLTEEDKLHIVGMVDPRVLGLDAPAMIGVSLTPGVTEEAISVIAAFPEVCYMVMVSGEVDLIVEVICRDRDHLTEFLNEKLRLVNGVLKTQTYTILRTYKNTNVRFR